MTEQAKNETKMPIPPPHFHEAHDVVEDDSLSKTQKVRVLDTLEQDARQMAEATSEGMAGGERNKLHDVLVAKDKLISPDESDPDDGAP